MDWKQLENEAPVSRVVAPPGIIGRQTQPQKDIVTSTPFPAPTAGEESLI